MRRVLAHLDERLRLGRCSIYAAGFIAKAPVAWGGVNAARIVPKYIAGLWAVKWQLSPALPRL